LLPTMNTSALVSVMAALVHAGLPGQRPSVSWTVIMAESVKVLEKLLSEWITPLLSPRGYRKSGLTYEKDDAEAIVVIGYQRSVHGGACDRFTVNLGIGSKRLFAFEDQRKSKRTPVELCHWRMRLGRTLEESSDVWWELCGPEDLAAVGQEQQEILTTRALPLLEKTASDEALRVEWMAGKAPGLTELQRLLNLSVLLDDSNHRSEQRAVIEGLKDLASRKGFGGRVAVQLEALGVE
jgi:hypothetical protein